MGDKNKCSVNTGDGDEKAILLMVDMQVGFMENDRVKALADKLEGLLASGAFDEVLATRFVSLRNDPFEWFLDWDRLQTCEEQAIVPSLLPYTDYVLDKVGSYGCLRGDLVAALFRANGGLAPSKVFVAGADTDACVLSCALDLFEMGIRPVVLAAFCASSGGEEREWAGEICLSRNVGKRQMCYLASPTREELLAF